VILVDTHALVWLVAAPARLSRAATAAIRRARATRGLAEGLLFAERGQLKAR
jgi:PIN domain nuclease of toxin-antitoxin system